jgi:hypothetical protein
MTLYSTCLRKCWTENSRTVFRSRRFCLPHTGVHSGYLLILMGCRKLPLSVRFPLDNEYIVAFCSNIIWSYNACRALICYPRNILKVVLLWLILSCFRKSGSWKEGNCQWTKMKRYLNFLSRYSWQVFCDLTLCHSANISGVCPKAERNIPVDLNL